MLNRSDYLIRQLNYYSEVGFKGWVCIGDSSDAEHVEKTKRAVHALGSQLNIIYRACPRPSSVHSDPIGTPGDGMCVNELIEMAPTEYAVVAGDDDFVIPRRLAKCVEFLESNADYGAAHGVRVDILLQSREAFGDLASATYVPEPVIESDSASERWIVYLRHASSLAYPVHRVKTWRRMYRDFASVPMRYLGSELLICGISAILGTYLISGMKGDGGYGGARCS